MGKDGIWEGRDDGVADGVKEGYQTRTQKFGNEKLIFPTKGFEGVIVRLTTEVGWTEGWEEGAEEGPTDGRVEGALLNVGWSRQRESVSQQYIHF